MNCELFNGPFTFLETYIRTYDTLLLNTSASCAQTDESVLGTATDLLDVPKRPTCMNASHCPEREIIGHVTFQRPHTRGFSLCAGKKQVVSPVLFVGISRFFSAEPSPGCLLGCTMCELPGGVAGDENGVTRTRTCIAYVHRRGRRHQLPT